MEAVTKRINEVEGVADAVRADLSPEIGEVQDGIERWGDEGAHGRGGGGA